MQDTPTGVGLEDQFGPSTVAVKKPKFLCAPTDKNNENPGAELHAEHLKGYQIKPAAKRVLPTNLTVTDQFHPAPTGLVVDAKKESRLLLPTVKSLSTPPPLPGAFVVDHFQCYKAKLSKSISYRKAARLLGVSVDAVRRAAHVFFLPSRR